jgi:hypothetical protein
LTIVPTVTLAVLVVAQLPALLEQLCAFAWLAPMAVPSTIAARITRVAFIVVILLKCFDGAGARRSGYSGPFKQLVLSGESLTNS